jgi:hypothetical protein
MKREACSTGREAKTSDFGQKREEKRPVGKPWRRWEDNNKTNL